MKAVSVLLGATAVLAVAQPHNHAHRHVGRHGSPVERRAADVTSYVKGPTVTVYELDGQDIPADEVAKGLTEGWYILVSDTTSSTSSVPTTTSIASTTSAQAAEFYEKKSSSSSSTTTPSTTSSSTTTSTYVAPTTTTTTQAPTTSSTTTTSSAAAASTSSSGSSSGSGVSSDFPSGSISCSTFPSSYGPVALDYLGLDGWIGIQDVPGYTTSESSISYISTATSGGCVSNSFCSYACPAGYQKSQWPTAQGSTGQSVGGLYCNSDGMLELSNSDYSTLCIPGTGGISVSSTLDEVVSVCRTDYPGTESETVPVEVEPGTTEPLTCPDASTYYSWEGAATSAQYYINPKGYGASEACKWGSSGTNIGNWAPVNLGVGKGTDGNIWISMFQNSPTNTDGCLDYSITITGDVSAVCSYKNCKFYTNGVESSSGCTTMVSGSAVYELS